MRKKKHEHQGFTLIELSVVLLIIGLIVGGILVGQDLIKAAEIRATISQIEKFHSAANTFVGKYGGLPGDLQYKKAAAEGLYTFGIDCGTGAHQGPGSIGCGDGNGLIEPAGALPDGSGEELAFWRHLSDAQMIQGIYGATGSSKLTSSGQTTDTVQGPNVANSLPPAAIGRDIYVIAFAGKFNQDNGYNYYELLAVDQIYNGYGSDYSTHGGLTPIEALAIDTKMDDGMPNTGTVLALGAGYADVIPASWMGAPSSGFCLTGGTSATDTAAIYNTNKNNGGGNFSCAIKFRFN